VSQSVPISVDNLHSLYRHMVCVCVWCTSARVGDTLAPPPPQCGMLQWPPHGCVGGASGACLVGGSHGGKADPGPVSAPARGRAAAHTGRCVLGACSRACECSKDAHTPVSGLNVLACAPLTPNTHVVPAASLATHVRDVLVESGAPGMVAVVTSFALRLVNGNESAQGMWCSVPCPGLQPQRHHVPTLRWWPLFEGP
jgi:hypothetical protein